MDKTIEIKNMLKDFEVSVEKQTDDEIIIKINLDEKTKLADLKPGTNFKIGNHEFIVLGHGEDTTAVILKDFLYTGVFDSNTNDYKNSSVRKNINGAFRKEIEDLIGAENLVAHKVKLTANDGLKDYGCCMDKVSLITADNYRRYRVFLPGYGEWWWTATPFSTKSNGYSRVVSYVNSDGALDWYDCGDSLGVRPFCIFSSSISVSLSK